MVTKLPPVEAKQELLSYGINIIYMDLEQNIWRAEINGSTMGDLQNLDRVLGFIAFTEGTCKIGSMDSEFRIFINGEEIACNQAQDIQIHDTVTMIMMAKHFVAQISYICDTFLHVVFPEF